MDGVSEEWDSGAIASEVEDSSDEVRECNNQEESEAQSSVDDEDDDRPLSVGLLNGSSEADMDISARSPLSGLRSPWSDETMSPAPTSGAEAVAALLLRAAEALGSQRKQLIDFVQRNAQSEEFARMRTALGAALNVEEVIVDLDTSNNASIEM